MYVVEFIRRTYASARKQVIAVRLLTDSWLIGDRPYLSPLYHEIYASEIYA